MRTVVYGNAALLGPNGLRGFKAANLYEITLSNGTVLYFTTWEKDLTWNGHTYLHGAPYIETTNVKVSIGTQTDELKLTIKAAPEHLINGIPAMAAIRTGALGNAGFVQYKVYMDASATITPGTCVIMRWFTGNIGSIDSVGGNLATLTVRSLFYLLNTQVPRRKLQPSCPFTLFDGGCTLVRATFKTSAAVIAGSTVNSVLFTNAQATTYFALGVIEFTSGANAGLKRLVRIHTHGTPSLLVLSNSLPNPPSAGDTFDVYPGCDKTQSTCDTKFANLSHFGGTPYVPTPETAI